MSGRTGKMTAEALRERGPRMVLARDLDSNDLFNLVYFREDQQPAGRFAVVAKSYSMNYLKRIARFNA
jgi:hypothetical protein